MPTLHSGVNLALNAILAHQRAIEVIEHNVANANTPGYHRQESVLSAELPYPYPTLLGGAFAGQMGNGVMTSRINRFNLDFFDGRYRRTVGEAKQWELASNMLAQVEATLAETSTDGLIPKLDAFWKGWQALSSDPANMALRAELRADAENLAEAIHGRAEGLIAFRKDQDLAIEQRVSEINTAASLIARLNAEIVKVKAAGDQPNDLLDQRDQLLNRLSEIAGAVSYTQENGEAVVSIGRHALVVGSTAFELETSPDPANNNLASVTWVDDGQVLDAPSGEIASLFDVRDRVVPDQLSGLNTLAYELATRVNTLHRGGYGLNNATNLDFFEPFTTTDYALEIRISDNLNDLNNLAAAGGMDSPGDGSQAAAIHDISAGLFMNGGTTTLNQYYTQKIGELGVEVKTASDRASDKLMTASYLKAQHESAVGVSLDEEAANLVKSQRAYQAAARLMNVMDDMLDRVINGMGLVGR